MVPSKPDSLSPHPVLLLFAETSVLLMTRPCREARVPPGYVSRMPCGPRRSRRASLPARLSGLSRLSVPSLLELSPRRLQIWPFVDILAPPAPMQ